MRIAIITGASSGLGSEIVKQLDAKPESESKIEEIWIIARRRDRLEALSKRIRSKTRIFTYDLTQTTSFDEFEEVLKQEQPNVTLLINAAGAGKIGSYEDITRAENDEMIALNCRAAVDMTQIVIPYMKAGSHIMEVCSSAAYQPVPYMNVYASGKAFLLHYSRALRRELITRGIFVTAICPYWIKDTEFIYQARNNTSQNERNSWIRHFPLATSVSDAASCAIRDTMAGRAVSTPGVFSTMQRLFARFFMTDALLGIWEILRRV